MVKTPLSSGNPLAGIAKSVPIQVGTFKGTTSFSVFKMKDPKIVIGLDFLKETSAVILPHFQSIFIPGHEPVVTKTIPASKGNQSLAALQLKGPNPAAGQSKKKKRFVRDFQVGDQVMVKTSPQEGPLLPSQGPFTITKKVGKVAYKLNFPGKWKIHPYFHVGRLHPSIHQRLAPPANQQKTSVQDTSINNARIKTFCKHQQPGPFRWTVKTPTSGKKTS
jgi:hypothetical protein